MKVIKIKVDGTKSKEEMKKELFANLDKEIETAYEEHKKEMDKEEEKFEPSRLYIKCDEISAKKGFDREVAFEGDYSKILEMLSSSVAQILAGFSEDEKHIDASTFIDFKTVLETLISNEY